MEIALICLGLFLYIVPIRAALAVFKTYHEELQNSRINTETRLLTQLIWYLFFIYVPIVNIFIIFRMIRQRNDLKRAREISERMANRNRFIPRPKSEEENNENGGIGHGNGINFNF